MIAAPLALAVLAAWSGDWGINSEALRPLREEAARLAAACALRADAVCFKLRREVEIKPAAQPDASFRPWNESTSFVSRALLPNIEGIMTPFTWAPEARDFWLDALELSESALAADLTFEATRFPLGSVPWRTVWKRRVQLRTGSALIMREPLLDREFRVTMLLSLEPDRSLCRLPPLPHAR